MIGPSFLKKVWAILIIFLFTFIHLKGLRLGTKVQNVLTLLKVVLIGGLVLLGFLIGRGSGEHFTQGKPVGFDFAGID